jgi:hypothetical protein
MLIVSSNPPPHFSHFKIIAMRRPFTGSFRVYRQSLTVKEVRCRPTNPSGAWVTLQRGTRLSGPVIARIRMLVRDRNDAPKLRMVYFYAHGTDGH